VNLFMGKFKKHGFIEKDDGVLHVNPSLLHVVDDGDRDASNGTSPAVSRTSAFEERRWLRAG
jgi:hypothetical protein